MRGRCGLFCLLEPNITAEVKNISSLICLSKAALLTAALGACIMVNVCVMKKLHYENEDLVIISEITGWCF